MLDKVVAGGHSFGGCTALALAADQLTNRGAWEKLTPRVRACFTLDPAVDWVPQRLWAAIGYTGVYKDRTQPETSPTPSADDAAPAPLVARSLPVLNVRRRQAHAKCSQCCGIRLCGPQCRHVQLAAICAWLHPVRLHPVRHHPVRPHTPRRTPACCSPSLCGRCSRRSGMTGSGTSAGPGHWSWARARRSPLQR